MLPDALGDGDRRSGFRTAALGNGNCLVFRYALRYIFRYKLFQRVADIEHIAVSGQAANGLDLFEDVSQVRAFLIFLPRGVMG